MSFTNDKFQIFVNKTPLNNSSNTSILPQPQNNTHVKTFTLSAGGIYQSNLLENPLNTATLSSENLHGSTNSFNDYQGNVYVKDTYNAYDNELVQTPTYPDDAEERSYGSGLSNSSKKIRKEMLSSNNFRAWGNKKAMQEELKMKTKRNPWQPEEDDQVLDLVAKYGQSWALIASLMKERSGKQIRDRYLNKLRPDINKGEWTEREDEILISLCTKIGHKWSRIATHLPGRTEGQVKNRFYSHIKKRLPKWHTAAGIPEQSEEEEELYQDESQYENKRHYIKQEAMGFGLSEGAKANKKVLCLNSGNVQTNTGFGSFNIKVNTIGQTVDGAKFLGSRADPTDVISYTGLANMQVKTHYTTADDAKSPYQLSSTRASSLSQDKEFEENYGKMSKMWTEGAQANANKAKMISFSLMNGNLVANQKPVVSQQVNKLDFSSGQGKISLNIF